MSRIRTFLAPLAVLLAVLAALSSPAQQTAETQQPWLNTSLPTDQRVDALLSQMTLEEKVQQMRDHAPAIPRLGVPKYDWWNEGLHGVAFAGYATNFPQVIGMAATWDTQLVHTMGQTISIEARAKYDEAIRNNQHEQFFGLTFWAPNINIFRDPRWGRGQETYGEDPFLTGRMAVAFVTGMQGDDSRYFRVVSTPKHYAVHSMSTSLRTTSKTLTSPPSAPPSLKRTRNLSCAPTTPSTELPPAPTPCCCRIISATPGTLTATSSPIAPQPLTFSPAITTRPTWPTPRPMP
jgi:beta-glucosidase